MPHWVAFLDTELKENAGDQQWVTNFSFPGKLTAIYYCLMQKGIFLPKKDMSGWQSYPACKCCNPITYFLILFMWPLEPIAMGSRKPPKIDGIAGFLIV